MISYAQNLEDVMLARAFAGQGTGFYIDIGVWHPTIDSVTRHFYDLGWHGVNVEPLPEQYALIAAARPRDFNLCAAVCSQPGTVMIHRISGTGLSTLRHDHAATHEAAGFRPESIEVPTIGLEQLCDEHSAGRTIDFMKIDVEGAEAEVIASGNWTRFRPRVLVVEATVPNSPVAAYADWEPGLLQADYHFVYFDGLNRWYVRGEDEVQLRPAFHAPPNPFDDYRLAGMARLADRDDRIAQLEQRLTSALKKADRLDRLGATLLGKLLLRRV